MTPITYHTIWATHSLVTNKLMSDDESRMMYVTWLISHTTHYVIVLSTEYGVNVNESRMSHPFTRHEWVTNEPPISLISHRICGSFVTHSHRLHIYEIRLIPYARGMLVSLHETYAKRIPYARDMTHLTHKLSLRKTCFVLVNRRTDDRRQAYGLLSVRWVNLTLYHAYRIGVSGIMCASNTRYIRIPMDLELVYRPIPSRSKSTRHTNYWVLDGWITLDHATRIGA